MPRPAGDRSPPDRWRWLGLLLPREARERVFEPAFADLTRAWIEDTVAGRPHAFGSRVVATWLGCIPIALPLLLVRRRRLTRAARILVWGGTVAVVVLLVVANLRAGYGSYGP